MPAKTGDAGAAPNFLPNFGPPQWLMVGLLCAAGLWLAMGRDGGEDPELDSISMAGARADYYLESFTLLSTQPNGDADFRLAAETLIHLPNEKVARVQNPRLHVSGRDDPGTDWELTAATGLLPDDGQSVSLINGVQLLQRSEAQSPVRLSTPNLLLDRQEMRLSSDTGVRVEGQGWQLQADTMSADVDTGTLTFKGNSHAQYTRQPDAN